MAGADTEGTGAAFKYATFGDVSEGLLGVSMIGYI